MPWRARRKSFKERGTKQKTQKVPGARLSPTIFDGIRSEALATCARAILDERHSHLMNAMLYIQYIKGERELGERCISSPPPCVPFLLFSVRVQQAVVLKALIRN